MDPVLQTMKDHGCDVDGALKRTLNDETFLLRCMRMALDEPEFEQLGEALRQQDVKSAFEYAHALKGVTANVGLQPLYECMNGIVEPLRAGTLNGVQPEYERLLQLRSSLRQLMV